MNFQGFLKTEKIYIYLKQILQANFDMYMLQSTELGLERIRFEVRSFCRGFGSSVLQDKPKVRNNEH